MKILGEGKPENQNHAMIFCFSESIQTVDMNQENHLAEAFKMRNLLQARLHLLLPCMFIFGGHHGCARPVCRSRPLTGQACIPLTCSA